MELVGQRVDHGNARILGELFEHRLLEKTRDDSVCPAFEASCHVGNRFAFAETRRGVVQECGRAAEAGDADFECNASSQRRLLENQREESPGKRAAVAVGTSLDVRGELKDVANLRGAPFHAG